MCSHDAGNTQLPNEEMPSSVKNIYIVIQVFNLINVFVEYKIALPKKVSYIYSSLLASEITSTSIFVTSLVNKIVAVSGLARD